MFWIWIALAFFAGAGAMLLGLAFLFSRQR